MEEPGGLELESDTTQTQGRQSQSRTNPLPLSRREPRTSCAGGPHIWQGLQEAACSVVLLAT